MATIPREQRLFRRSRTDRIFGGVCGGIAHYFGIDTLPVRLLFVVLAITAGAGLLLYLLLWIVMPLEDAQG